MRISARAHMRESSNQHPTGQTAAWDMGHGIGSEFDLYTGPAPKKKKRRNFRANTSGGKTRATQDPPSRCAGMIPKHPKPLTTNAPIKTPLRLVATRLLNTLNRLFTLCSVRSMSKRVRGLFFWLSTTRTKRRHRHNFWRSRYLYNSVRKVSEPATTYKHIARI